MVSYQKNLSTTRTVVLSSDLDNITFKSYTRYFDGGYSLTFYNALSGVRDYSYKNYTNFFLTRDTQLSNIIEGNIDVLKSESVLTTMDFGGKYLTFTDPNMRKLALSGIYQNYDEYGAYTFTDAPSGIASNFVITIKDNNLCNIYHLNDYKKYYLTVDSNDILNFYTENVGLSVIDFDYIYSRSTKSIYLFYKTGGVSYLVKKQGSNLTLNEMTSSNKISVYNNSINISKDLYTDLVNNNDTTYIEYSDDNTISEDGIQRGLTNNYLLHREDSTTDIMVLKNQLVQGGVFTSGNNLLSSETLKYFVDGMRDYTSIFDDVKSEKDEELSLNYVIYNKSYHIKPGQNTLIAPDIMSPYIQLNINDSKFIDSGAFGFPTPIYADKVFRKDTRVNYSDKQTYLCTWLSGTPLSDSKVWVDRYYYPDYISKQEALFDDNSFNVTYEDQIEVLINQNSNLQDSITGFNVFDKKSDMVFIPSETYVYDRLDSVTIQDTISAIPLTPCDNLLRNGNYINYFRGINESGKMSVSFYFDGDDRDWVFESKRNNIDGGLKITKRGGFIDIELNLYDPSVSSFVVKAKTVEYKPLKLNFISVSVDTIAGSGYFFFNNEVSSEFGLDETRFTIKKIIFGDFVIDDDSVFSDSQDKIRKIRILNDYTTKELSFITPILDGESKIDDLYITLPCGMRNSTDNVEYLQSVCNNQTFKSNHINLYIKNINIDTDTQADVKNLLNGGLDRFTPLTTEINNIKFENYK